MRLDAGYNGRVNVPGAPETARARLGRRILVLGSSGSGKTHFSERLARILDLDVIHLDAEFWRRGWIATPEQEWRGKVSTLVQRTAWIMDGTYENTLDLRVPAADTIIVLERERLACLWGVLRRVLFQRAATRADAPPGQRLDRAFLRYVWHYSSVVRPLVLERIHCYGWDKRLIVLRGSRCIAQFLEGARQGTWRAD
jgi:adenylate kinase family enzyme